MKPETRYEVRGTRNKNLGFTLVELIMFIVIMGVVAVAMVQAFSGTMRGSHFGKELTQGTQLAQQRMEVILGQRKTLGYTLFTTGDYDPCQSGSWTGPLCIPLPPCVPGNYCVASIPPVACGTGCSEITVKVASPYDTVTAACGSSDGPICLVAQVWNY